MLGLGGGGVGWGGVGLGGCHDTQEGGSASTAQTINGEHGEECLISFGGVVLCVVLGRGCGLLGEVSLGQGRGGEVQERDSASAAQAIRGKRGEILGRGCWLGGGVLSMPALRCLCPAQLVSAICVLPNCHGCRVKSNSLLPVICGILAVHNGKYRLCRAQ